MARTAAVLTVAAQQCLNVATFFNPPLFFLRLEGEEGSGFAEGVTNKQRRLQIQRVL